MTITYQWQGSPTLIYLRYTQYPMFPMRNLFVRTHRLLKALICHLYLFFFTGTFSLFLYTMTIHAPSITPSDLWYNIGFNIYIMSLWIYQLYFRSTFLYQDYFTFITVHYVHIILGQLHHYYSTKHFYVFTILIYIGVYIH